VIRKRDALRVLTPYLELLAVCVINGWLRWQRRVAPNMPAGVTKRGITNCLWECFAGEARNLFDADPDVQVIEEHETLRMVVADCISLRFKKLDAQLRVSGRPTRRAMLVVRHGNGGN